MYATSLALVLLLASFVTSAVGAEPDAAKIIERAKSKYERMSAYRLVRATTVEESSKDGERRPIAELTFTTATEGGTVDRSGGLNIPVNLKRVRLEIRGDLGTRMFLANNDQAWIYSSRDKQYVVSDRFGSVAGSMELAMHLSPLIALSDGVLQKTKMVAEEKLRIGDLDRDVLVVKGEVPGFDFSDIEEAVAKGKDFPLHFGPDKQLVYFQLQGVAGKHGVLELPKVIYSASSLAERKPDAKPFPTEIKLWIDRDDYTLWKSEMTQMAFKSDTEGKSSEEKVELRLNDVFSIIESTSPEGTFDFEPPKGTNKVKEIGRE